MDGNPVIVVKEAWDIVFQKTCAEYIRDGYKVMSVQMMQDTPVGANKPEMTYHAILVKDQE